MTFDHFLDLAEPLFDWFPQYNREVSDKTRAQLKKCISCETAVIAAVKSIEFPNLSAMAATIITSSQNKWTGHGISGN
jgi:hypothetical protein